MDLCASIAQTEACTGACENSAKAQSDGGSGLKKCLSTSSMSVIKLLSKTENEARIARIAHYNDNEGL